jgi:hypothetical protein
MSQYLGALFLAPNHHPNAPAALHFSARVVENNTIKPVEFGILVYNLHCFGNSKRELHQFTPD